MTTHSLQSRDFFMAKAALVLPPMLPINLRHTSYVWGTSAAPAHQKKWKFSPPLRVSPSEGNKCPALASKSRIDVPLVYCTSMCRGLNHLCESKLSATPWGFQTSWHKIVPQSRHIPQNSHSSEKQAKISIPSITMCVYVPIHTFPSSHIMRLTTEWACIK